MKRASRRIGRGGREKLRNARRNEEMVLFISRQGRRSRKRRPMMRPPPYARCLLETPVDPLRSCTFSGGVRRARCRVYASVFDGCPRYETRTRVNERRVGAQRFMHADFHCFLHPCPASFRFNEAFAKKRNVCVAFFICFKHWWEIYDAIMLWKICDARYA